MHRFVFWLGCLSLAMTLAPGQTLSPPLAEYRGKADGMLWLRNDGDVPLAALLEVRGFQVNDKFDVDSAPLDAGIRVDLGTNSFVIPPHQMHYVFYKAAAKTLPAWFAIVCNLTQAKPLQDGMRINFVFPHLVYVYQKAKFNKEDITVRALPAADPGEYRLEFQNSAAKLGRIKGIQTKGFSPDGGHGGFPLFPHETRLLIVKAGKPTEQSRFQIQFEDGLRLEERLQDSTPSPAGVRAALNP
jgi:hypothetical protein